MYQYSTSDIRAKVSQNYEHVTEAQLHQFIRVIANCRNVCAHGERLQGKADHVYLLQGGGSRKEKDVMRTQMRSVPDGESVVLVAIDKYVGEGFNYPR